MQWLRRFFSLPETTPTAVVLAIFFYCGHLVCSGWVASSECGAAFAMMAVAYALYRHQITPSFNILYFPLIAYAFASTISALAAPRAIHSFGENALWGKIALFPAALILFRQVPRSRELALRALLIFGGFAASFGLFQYFVLARRDLEHRITGPAAHVMTLSGLLLPSALLFLVLWMHDRKNPWLLAGTILLTLKRPRMLIVAAPLLVFFVTFMPLPLFSRVVSSFDVHQSSNLDRIRMVQAGVEIIKEYPLLGVGPANIKEVYPLYRKHDAPRFRIPHLHNNFVQLWAERGILALAAYVLLIGLFLRECARAWNGSESRFAEVGVAVTVGLVAAGMFEFNFGDTEVFWIFLDICALVIAFTEQPRLSNEQSVS